MDKIDDPPVTPSFSMWDDVFLRALGYLLVQANYLEDALIDLYWIVKGKARHAAVEDSRGKTLGQLCTQVVTAYEERFPEGDLRDRLETLKPELRRAIDKRNEFVHASWAFDSASEVMHRSRIPRERGAAKELRRLGVSDVEAAIELIGGVAERVWEDLYDSVELATRGSRSFLP